MDTKTGLDGEIRKIGLDQEKGATELAILSALALNRSRTIGEMHASAEALLYMKPMMAPIVNLATGVKACPTMGQAQNFLRNFLRSMQKGQEEVASHFVSLLLKNHPECEAIVTLSASTLVEACIMKLYDRLKSIKVIVAESRPKMEGTALAKRLGTKIKGVFVTWDASIFAFLRRGVIAVVGADAVLKETFVNKAPTLALCLVAKSNRVPVFVVTTSHTVLEPTAEPYFSVPKPRQIEAGGVCILDHQFDVIPRPLVDYIVTDKGLLS